MIARLGVGGLVVNLCSIFGVLSYISMEDGGCMLTEQPKSNKHYAYQDSRDEANSIATNN